MITRSSNEIPNEWQRFFEAIDSEIGQGKCRRAFPELEDTDGMSKEKRDRRLSEMYRMGTERILKRSVDHLLTKLGGLRLSIHALALDRDATYRERDTLMKVISTLISDAHVEIGRTEIKVTFLDGGKHSFPYQG